MKKQEAIVLILICISMMCNAQKWTNITPDLFTHNDFNTVHMKHTGESYICTTKGYLLHTTDTGALWHNEGKIHWDYLSDIYFKNQDTAFLAGKSAIYRSIDGGNTWQLVAQLPLEDKLGNFYGSILNIQFLNQNKGFGVGSKGIIWKTNDGGTTWIEAAKLGFDGVFDAFSNFHFRNDDTAYVWAYDGYRAFTFDGGDTWNADKTPQPNNFWITSTHFFDADNGIAGTFYDQMLRTSNGGATWAMETTMSYGVDIEFINDTTGYWLSTHTIYKTQNAGNTWTELYNNANYIFMSLDFTDSIGFISAKDGQIFRTTDAGMNWQRQSLGAPGSFNELCLHSPHTAYINMNDGYVLKTSDGGNNWKHMFVDDNRTIKSMACTSNETLYVGSMSAIYKSNDGGDSWLKTTTFAETDDFIVFPSVDTGFAGASNYGDIEKTYDAGFTWQPIYSFTTKIDLPIKSISFPSPTTGYITSLNGQISKTEDAGNTWQRKDAPVNIHCMLSHFKNDSTGFVFGYGGEVLKTENGGDTWTQVFNSNTRPLKFFEGYGEQYFITLFAQSDSLLLSLDGGATWQKTDRQILWNNIGFAGNDIGYASWADSIYKIEFREQTLQLDSGWNLVSFHKLPDNRQLQALLPSIFDNMKLIKDDNGFYNPSLEQYLLSLDSVDFEHAYLISMNKADSITISGNNVPSGMASDIKKGWNLFSYPLSYSVPMDDICLGKPIEHIKNFEGFYIPGGPDNSLTTFEPGKGYILKASSECIIKW